jgi:hypothetical protein
MPALHVSASLDQKLVSTYRNPLQFLLKQLLLGVYRVLRCVSKKTLKATFLVYYVKFCRAFSFVYFEPSFKATSLNGPSANFRVPS